jgi:hypothetical protein
MTPEKSSSSWETNIPSDDLDSTSVYEYVASIYH